ncbi:MAG TPA: hypothetical protein VNH11_09610 [Pirellulales bacterium]|nr:hypothetical protein [Pirellulales bacterium]
MSQIFNSSSSLAGRSFQCSFGSPSAGPTYTSGSSVYCTIGSVRLVGV